MSWMDDYTALREDIHQGYIYEAIEAILYLRAHEEIPADEQWRFSEMMGACCGALADTEGAIAAYFEAATDFTRKKRRILQRRWRMFRVTLLPFCSRIIPSLLMMRRRTAAFR